MDSGGEFAGAAARVIEQPQNGTLITTDAEYYLNRASKLVVDREGVIRVINGIPAFNAVLPEKPDQTLALYDFVLGGNTDNDSDVTITKIEHKRFTMKDIAQLEKRLANLEEVTSLSLLEVDTKHLQVLDSAGNNRTKSGFIVDNFTDHSKSFTNSGYRAAIDPLQQELRPGFKEDNIRLIYDSAASTNTIRKGDNIYIAYDETPYINQNFASKSIRLNPFSVVIYEGLVTLSPSSDEWRDVDRRQDKIVQGGTRLSTVNAYNWNNWSWSWGGVSLENLQVGSSTNVQSGIVNRVVSEETVLDLIEDRVIQTAFLPFMRSRKVFFRAQGLRPNTRVFPFLDGNNISDFTRSETFQFYSDTDSDFGNTLKNTTAHPDGALNLTTDANGDISGSFIVPNNDTLKIRVGTKEFKILDISADNEENAACIAKTPYTATGFLDTKEATYASTRQLNVLGVNIRRRAIYNSDTDHRDDKKTKSPTTISGSWVTGPEAIGISYNIDYSDFAGVTSLTGNTQYSNDANSSNDGGNSGHDGTDGGYGGADNSTDYGGT